MSAKISECVGGELLVEVSSERGACVTWMHSRKAAEVFVRVVEQSWADDRREGRVSGAASLGEPIQ